MKTNKKTQKLTVAQQAELFNVRKDISLNTVKISDVKNNIDYVTVTLSNGKYVLYNTYRVAMLFASDYGEKVTDENGDVIGRENSNVFNGNLHCIVNDTDSKTAVFRAEYDVITYKDENGDYNKNGIQTDEYVTGIVSINHDADENLQRDNSKMVIADLLLTKKADFNKYARELRKAENDFYKSIKNDSNDSKNDRKNGENSAKIEKSQD